MILGEERKVTEFKRYTGVGEFSVLGFNFDKDTIIKKCGYDPGNEPVYVKTMPVKVGNETKEVRTANISVFLKEVNTGINMRTGFILKEADDIAQSGNIKYVNNKCDNSYVLLDWFKRHDHRRAFIAEADFLQFIRNWLSNFVWFDKNDPMGGAKYPLKENLRLFDGNFNALNDLARRYPQQTVGVLCGIRDSDKGQKQDTCNRAFLQGGLVSKAQSLIVGGDNSQYLNTLSKYQADSLRAFIDKVEGQYGYKNFHGTTYKFREYDPSTNVVAGNNSALIGGTMTPNSGSSNSTSDDLNY